jgi:hypothetical protein
MILGLSVGLGGLCVLIGTFCFLDRRARRKERNLEIGRRCQDKSQSASVPGVSTTFQSFHFANPLHCSDDSSASTDDPNQPPGVVNEYSDVNNEPTARPATPSATAGGGIGQQVEQPAYEYQAEQPAYEYQAVAGGENLLNSSRTSSSDVFQGPSGDAAARNQEPAYSTANSILEDPDQFGASTNLAGSGWDSTYDTSHANDTIHRHGIRMDDVAQLLEESWGQQYSALS